MTSNWNGFKRLTYLVHRWTGVGACLLMMLWFVSGIVMLFVGYPKLTPSERLARVPSLDASQCCVSVQAALAASADPATVRQIVLTSLRGHPVYRVREGNGRYRMIDARTGAPDRPVDVPQALDSARAFTPGVRATYLGRIHEDRWTHSGSLDAHRPLYEVQMDDPSATLLYVSSTTGEVVMAAPRSQRLWNYVGAWLHWVYLFKSQPVDPVWSWIVIGLSAVGVVVSLSGTLAGLWRWRFRERYKSGSRSPYRNPYLRWHHIAGLAFATITFTWIFSGLMSMNPLGVFKPGGGRPDTAAYQGGTPGTTQPSITAQQAILRLRAQGFSASELEWRVMAGQPYLLARDGSDHTRLLFAHANSVDILAQWPASVLHAAANRLISYPIASTEQLNHYDAYYYRREPQAMMGAVERRLPVLRVRFDDPGRTWVHLDLYTGDVVLSEDKAQRVGRWLFNFLHSWDLPVMLHAGILREGVLILLSLGGLVLSATGVVIGYARLRIKLSKVKRATLAQRLRQLVSK